MWGLRPQAEGATFQQVVSICSLLPILVLNLYPASLLLQGPPVAFPQHQARPTAALPRPAAPVAKKRVLQLVNPDTKEAVDLASVAKEASKLQARRSCRPSSTSPLCACFLTYFIYEKE